MTESQSCQFCGGDQSGQLIPVDHVWTYLFHSTLKPDIRNGEALPKLTFTLAIGRTSSGNDDEEDQVLLPVCGDCQVEFDRLEGLVRQLEGIKREIYSQVERMKGKRQGNGGLEGMMRNWRGRPPPPSRGNSVLEGSTSGREEIGKTLQFLEGYCQAMCGLPESPVVKTEPDSMEGPSEGSTPAAVVVNEESSQNPGDAQSSTGHSEDHVMEESAPFVKLECILDNQSVEVEAHIINDEDQWNDLNHGTLVTPQDPLAIPEGTQEQLPPPPPPPIPHHLRKRRQKLVNNTPGLCPVCGKVIGTYKNALGIHLRTHTGERPYRCPLCDKRFAYRGDLTRHHRVVHDVANQLRFECQICRKTFNLKYNLTSHLKNVHHSTSNGT